MEAGYGLQVERDLLRRYDVAGPRYTSYPTALAFTEDYGEADYRAAIRHSNEDPIPRPLSLYVHIPFCASPCFYCGCTKVITRDRTRAAVYVDHLEREIDRVAALVDDDRLVKQLHFGGGTPTFLAPGRLDGLLEWMAGRFSFSAGLECAIEVDPRTVTTEQVAMLAASGFNRMSLGVQDFDPAVQAAVNRVQSPDDTLAVLEAARRACPLGVNVDLIYGLPNQTPESFGRTLETLVAARPSRIAAYGYAHLPERFKPQRRIRSEELPSPEEKLELLRLTIERLTGAGYVYIGMDHFAVPGDELVRARDEGRLHRNFQGYSSQAECDILGFGMSAIGDVGGAYVQNLKDIGAYQDAVAAGRLPVWRGYRATREDLLRRAVIQAVMCRDGLDFDAFAERFGVDFREHFAPELRRLETLEADGLVRLDGDGLRVTRTGRLLLRAVAMVFDAHLPPRGAPSAYSRIV